MPASTVSGIVFSCCNEHNVARLRLAKNNKCNLAHWEKFELTDKSLFTVRSGKKLGTNVAYTKQSAQLTVMLQHLIKATYASQYVQIYQFADRQLLFASTATLIKLL